MIFTAKVNLRICMIDIDIMNNRHSAASVPIFLLFIENRRPIQAVAAGARRSAAGRRYHSRRSSADMGRA